MSPVSARDFSFLLETRIVSFPDIINAGMVGIDDQRINVNRAFTLVLVVVETDKILAVFIRFEPAVELNGEKIWQVVLCRLFEEGDDAGLGLLEIDYILFSEGGVFNISATCKIPSGGKFAVLLSLLVILEDDLLSGDKVILVPLQCCL